MAGLAAITGPMDEIEGFRRSFEHRRNVVVEGLNAIPGITCRLPGGAFYAFPNIMGTGRDSGVFARDLLEKSYLAVLPGESFGANGKGYLRISYAAGEADIREALQRIGDFLAA
jgi:aspartate/methionine/tyrosine aminotransferase